MQQNALLAIALFFGIAIGAGGATLMSPGEVAASAAPQGIARDASGIAPTHRKETPELADAAASRSSSPATPDLAAKKAADRETFRREAAVIGSRIAAEPAQAREPSWTGSINGQLVDDKGAPIAGATVISDGVHGWFNGAVSANTTEKVGRAYTGQQSLEDELMANAKSYLERRQAHVEVITDGEGMFSMEDLEHGTHSLRAFADGFVFKPAQVEAEGSIQIVGSAVGSFHLDLRLPDGSAPTEAIIVTLEQHEREQVAAKWTPDAATVRLASSSPRIRIYSGDVRSIDYQTHAAAFVSEPMTLDPGADDEGPRTVQLIPQTQLRVTIRDESGSVTKITPWVKARPAGDKGGSVDVELARRSSGPFMVVGLEPGSYELLAGRGTAEPEFSSTIEVFPGINLNEIVFGETDASDYVIIRCTGPDGLPIAGVEFDSAVTTGEQRRRSGQIRGAVHRGAGEYWVGWNDVLRAGQSRDAVTLTITAKTPAYGDRSAVVDQEGHVDFTFTAACDLNVALINHPGGSVRVQAIPVSESEEGAMSFSGWNRDTALANSEGKASLGLFQPGEYTVRVATGGSRWNAGPYLVEEVVQLSPGPLTVTLACPDVHDLKVFAPEGPEGARLQLSIIPEDGTKQARMSAGGQAVLGSDLRASFTNLKAGRYKLVVWSESSMETMEVSVPSGEITFDPE